MLVRSVLGKCSNSRDVGVRDSKEILVPLVSKGIVRKSGIIILIGLFLLYWFVLVINLILVNMIGIDEDMVQLVTII